jgi:hypothetical protein
VLWPYPLTLDWAVKVGYTFLRVCPWQAFPAQYNCLWVRPGAYPRMEHLKGAPALPANIRLDCKGGLHLFTRLSLTSLSSSVYCLWVRPGAYPRVEHLKGAPALPVNIRLGCKGGLRLFTHLSPASLSNPV